MEADRMQIVLKRWLNMLYCKAIIFFAVVVAICYLERYGKAIFLGLFFLEVLWLVLVSFKLSFGVPEKFHYFVVVKQTLGIGIFIWTFCAAALTMSPLTRTAMIMGIAWGLVAAYFFVLASILILAGRPAK